MIAIFKREVRSYFSSPVGYVCVAALMALYGFYYYQAMLMSSSTYISAVFSTMFSFSMMIIPIITMRSMTDDQKNKTDQALLTAPVGVTSIVLGKFFACCFVYFIAVTLGGILPAVVMSTFSTPSWGEIIGNYIGALLYGAAMISIGVFISSLTVSQIIAAISSFGVLLILYLWNGILGFLPSSALLNLIILLVLLTLISALVWHITGNPVMAGILEVIFLAAGVIVYAVDSGLYESLLSDVLGQLDLTAPLTDVVSSSLLDTGSIILYLSVIGLFIFLTMQSIQKRRWS